MPKVTFIKADGTRIRVEAPIGETVLELAHEHESILKALAKVRWHVLLAT